MKKALVSHNRFVTDVVKIGEEFEIVESEHFKWLLCPDEVTSVGWIYEDSSFKKVIIEDTHHSRVISRLIAYGSITDQLAMQYDDAINGTTTWIDHIKNVKATTPRPGDLLP